ncbi:GAF domain-containing protein [Hymenobacter sp. RP-2-7]|uniref:GAF domain-containing protein n=1 Tax=Hymenobacter polaris TaxID=2682546 RepID=A0A7Y0FL81_9BACT|nr:GAF domain-containing protein [Hymenobacter polaris]NML64528.1 GAF domain-containing protein [Hymenobacter polaris]
MPPTFPATLLPADDAVRLRTLHQFQLINTTPELIFDNFSTWAAQLFGTPIALISLVDADFVWFKAIVGAEVPQLVREESMCAAAILVSERVVVSDYQPASCTLIKPDVAQAIGLNFYAGAQLHARNGARLGMLAIIDKQQRTFSEEQAAVLTRLADLVSGTIELRHQYLAASQPAEWDDAQQELAQALDDNAALTRYLASRSSHLDLADPATSQLIGRRLAEVAQVLARRLGVAA